MTDFKEPSTILLNREKKKKVVAKLKKLGLIFDRVLDRFFDELLIMKDEKIYKFMKKK